MSQMMVRLLIYAAAIALVQCQSGPFDVTTIVHLKQARLTLHARTNALGLPLKIGGSVTSPQVEALLPDCTAYESCEGWKSSGWVNQGSPGPMPPIEPQRVDEDEVLVGEEVRVQLNVKVGTDRRLHFGLCGPTSCSIVSIQGVDSNFTMGTTSGISTHPNVRDSTGEWSGSYSGPEKVSFEEDSVHTFVVKRASIWNMLVWHEKRPDDKRSAPLDPSRFRLSVDSGVGPTAFIKDDDKVRVEGDSLAEGQHARVHISNHDHVWLTMGLCSNSSCSVVRVEGVSPEGDMNWSTWISRKDNVRQDSPALEEVANARSDLLYAGTNVFVIHRTKTEMRVWLEGYPNQVAKVPLTPDKHKLRIDSHSGVATFLRDNVLSSQSSSASLVSPPVELDGDRTICLSFVYYVSKENSGLRLQALTKSGMPVDIANITASQAGVWLYNRTNIPVPKELRDAKWRLSVSPNIASEDDLVLIQRFGGCNSLSAEDVADLGATGIPAYLPGYNVSWDSPRPASYGRASYRCANGGKNDAFGFCICPPGFTGSTCSTGCGPNSYGFDCGGHCSSDDALGCRGLQLCAPGLPCHCAPGLQGKECDRDCEQGQYGVDCAQSCNHYCKDGDCDPYTGLCRTPPQFIFGEECGKAPRQKQLTWNGTVAPIEAFPWYGGLYKRDDIRDKHSFHCAAILVSPSLMISAAHCFNDLKLTSSRPLPPGQIFSVALGKVHSDWNAIEQGTVHRSRVSRVRVPTTYAGTTRYLDGDLAVLELEEPAPITRNIAPICVDSGGQLTDGQIVQIAGWGTSKDLPQNQVTQLSASEGDDADKLAYVSVPISLYSECVAGASTDFSKWVLRDKFCSLVKPGTNRNQGLAGGDSGGAVMSERDGVWYLNGVVSSHEKTHKHYLFTNVTFGDYVQWMRDVKTNLETNRPTRSSVVAKEPVSEKPLDFSSITFPEK